MLWSICCMSASCEGPALISTVQADFSSSRSLHGVFASISSSATDPWGKCFFLNWVVNIGTGSWIASYETNCRQNLVALQYMSPSALSCVNQLYGSVALEASRSTGLNALNHWIQIRMYPRWIWVEAEFFHRHPVASHLSQLQIQSQWGHTRPKWSWMRGRRPKPPRCSTQRRFAASRNRSGKAASVVFTIPRTNIDSSYLIIDSIDLFLTTPACRRVVFQPPVWQRL